MKTPKLKNIDELVGKVLPFYGALGDQLKIGRWVFQAAEDPSDGYRSMCQDVVEIKGSTTTFFPKPVARVMVVERDDSDLKGYVLKDVKDDFVWLEFGTNNSDDYYPSYVFSYHAKPPKTLKKPKLPKVVTVATLEQNLKMVDDLIEHLKNSDSSEAHAIQDCIEGGLAGLSGQEKIDMFKAMLSEFKEHATDLLSNFSTES